MYNFKRLIKKYSKAPPEFKRVEEGYFDYENGGQWIEGGVEWVEFEGAVVPIKQEVVFDNARYTTEDRSLYTYEFITEGDAIRYSDREYTAMEISDYGEFDKGLLLVMLKAGGVND